ncbi:ABC transporter permease [Nocardioides nanhaiensis]|uniref:ABC transporter permease n=1 Tax=Nocardioides nanhaiensis TaxID=1476871 RepID=A0ABP8W7B4_9ACTN
MSTTTATTSPASPASPASTPRIPAAAARRTEPLTRPPFSRLVLVELRKMFDTRAGFWLMASVGILAVVATGAVIAFAPDEVLTFGTFATAIGVPMTVLLPMITILSITSEWSQRSGLGTFTMVPHRGRVIAAKAVGSVLIGVVSMFVALGVGALGTLVGSLLTGLDPVWDVTVGQFTAIVGANLINMAIGFMLGVLTRSSAAGIVGYFVYSFVFTTVSEMLAAFQDWWVDARPWADFQYNQGILFERLPEGQEWLHLAVSSLPWLVLPLALGLWLVSRAEVK